MYTLSTATLAKPYDWVDHRDPAFDPEANGFVDDEGDGEKGEAKFFKAITEALDGNHRDRIAQWCRHGEKPTWWKLAHLGDDASRYLDDMMQANGGGMYVPFAVLKEAARLSICGVSELIGKDGRPFAIKQTETHPLCGARCLPRKTLDVLAQLDSGGLISRIGIQALRARNPQGNS